MDRKQRILRVLGNAFLIRTAVIFVIEALYVFLIDQRPGELPQVLMDTLVLSLVSFAVCALISAEDIRVTRSLSVLYAVFDLLIFSIGAGVFAIREMMGIQGGSGLVIVILPILAGVVMLPFSILLGVMTYRMIRRNFV